MYLAATASFQCKNFIFYISISKYDDYIIIVLINDISTKTVPKTSKHQINTDKTNNIKLQPLKNTHLK